MNRNQKTELVELTKQLLADNSMLVVLNYKGLTAGEISEFRNLLKSKGANIKVIKNTLAKKAVENTDFAVIGEYFADQVAVAFCKDPLTLSSILIKYADANENVEVKAGLMDGKLVDLSTIKELSKLGSIDDVRAKFIGVLKAPASGLVRILDAYQQKLSVEA